MPTSTTIAPRELAEPQRPLNTDLARPEAQRGPLANLLELGKARLSALVLMTTAVGFVLAEPGPIAWAPFLVTLAGTALAALGANAWNQILEAPRDARMLRTQRRPLPSGALSRSAAVWFATGCTLVGPLLLGVLVNWLAAFLALATLLIYVGLYTPMKVRTPLNTLVGAVCGAIPPMVGWSAAAGDLGAGAWVLAAILFVWQIPHFLALAWMYRDDYERGGFRMLPVIDRDGRATCQATLLYSVTLIPAAMMLTLTGATGVTYAIAAAALGAALSLLAWRFHRERTYARARAVFLASVIYLPLLLALMVMDRG